MNTKTKQALLLTLSIILAAFILACGLSTSVPTATPVVELPEPTPVPTTPPTLPAVPPTIEAMPEAKFEMEKELLIDGYAVRQWYNTAEDALMFERVVTISSEDQPTVQVDFASLLDLTGTDITGEGNTDVVIEGFSGGAHCCFSEIVYDLGPEVNEVLYTHGSNCGGRYEDLDGDGVYEFITCDDLFAYSYCPFVYSPAPMVVMKYEPNRKMYVIASPLYVDQYADDIAEHTAMAAGKPGDMGEWDETNKCSVLPLVLDYLYSGQGDKAWEAFDKFYVGDDVESFRPEIEMSVYRSPLYSE